jgi:hypothetical protein
MPNQPTEQLSRLRRQWPHTAMALASTYFPNEHWAVTAAGRYNRAGYALWGLARARDQAWQIYGRARYSEGGLDRAFARETRYHFERGTEFRSPIHALAACWYNLVCERPERLERAEKEESKCIGRSRRGAGGSSGELWTGTRWSSPGGLELAEGTRSLVGSVLRAWTRLS